MAFWDKFKDESKEKEKPEKPTLSSSQQARRAILSLVFKSVMLFMGAVALIYGGYNIISGASLFTPSSAKGVLKAVNTPDSYAWNSQVIRSVVLPGGDTPTEQHSVRGAVVDTKNNKFQTTVINVLPTTVTFNSDGRYTLQLAKGSSDWQIMTDVCNGDPAVPATTVQMPTPEQLLDANPKMETDEATFFGQRAWELSFEPTPEIISQVFWLDFFDDVILVDTLNDWVLSKSDREALKAGDFEAIEGTALVIYNEPRYIAQLDMRFKLGSSEYRTMAQVVPLNKENPIANKDFGPAPCETSADEETTSETTEG